MNAETLRRAAQRIRGDWTPGDCVDDTLLAVADWLEAIAPRFPSRLRDFEEHLLDREQAAALAVARAYLGEPL